MIWNTYRNFLNPSARAVTLFRAGSRPGVCGRLARSLLITLHASDVGVGARIAKSVDFPHPVGIVIGSGVIVEDDVRIWHGVTLGSDGRDGYPVVRRGAKLLTDSLIVGPIEIGQGATVGAKSFVRRSVVAGGVVTMPSTLEDGSGRAAVELASDIRRKAGK